MGRLAAVVLLCLASSAASAAPARYQRKPSTGPAAAILAPAELLWKDAEREPDAAKAHDRWRAAAVAFDAIAASGAVPDDVRGEAAYAAILAWKNALAVDPRVRTRPMDVGVVDEKPTPRPIPDDEATMIGAFSRYLELVPDAPDATGVRFLRGNIRLRFGHVDEALPDLIELVEHHQTDEVAEYAANLILDALNRAERYDELVARARAMRADAALMRDREDLAERLLMIERISRRKEAERTERDAKQRGDRDGYARCGALYDQVVELAPKAYDTDEARYNAAVCYEMAGDADAALARDREVLDRAPRSTLAPRAMLRSAALAERIGRIADAAAMFERYVAAYPGERDAADAALDAIALRIGLGDLAGAERDVDRFVKVFGAKRRDDAARAVTGIAALRLARGDRAIARKRIATRQRLLAPRASTEAGGLLGWDAACPIAPTDGLCLRHGRPLARDAKLAEQAYDELHRISPTPRSVMADVDARFEAWLLAPTRDEATGDQLRASYEGLLKHPEDDPDTKILAEARLGHLAANRQRPEMARAHYTACAEQAGVWGVPSRLATCDAGLRALGTAPAIARERIPAARPSTPGPGPEAPIVVDPTQP